MMKKVHPPCYDGKRGVSKLGGFAKVVRLKNAKRYLFNLIFYGILFKKT